MAQVHAKAVCMLCPPSHLPRSPLAPLQAWVLGVFLAHVFVAALAGAMRMADSFVAAAQRAEAAG